MKGDIFIGIDPGKKGAMVMIFKDELIIVDFTKEDLSEYCFKLMSDNKTHNLRTYLEDVGARGGQSITAMFSFPEAHRD